MKEKVLLGMFFCLLGPGFLLANSQADESVKINSYTLGEIEARSIGPAIMSGRITVIDAVNK